MASSAAPRCVSSPGSPGPAPTRNTRPVLMAPSAPGRAAGGVRASAPSARSSGAQAFGREQGPATVFVEQFARGGQTQGGGVGTSAVGAGNGAAVERREQHVDRQGGAGCGRERTARQVARTAQFGEESALGR